MAVIANNRGLNVCWAPAGRIRAVVAGTAGTQYLCVVNRCDRHKQIGVVTVFANVRCLHVRRTFSDRFRAIVARHAITDDVGVIEIYGQPGDGTVTIVAGVATGDMGRMFAGRDSAIVASATGAEDLGVIDSLCRHPYGWAVTILADVRGLNVCRAFARCL